MSNPLDPFSEWTLLQLPRGDAVEHIAFAIDHVSQHECRHHRATTTLAEKRRLRTGRVADNDHSAARPPLQPDNLEPVAVAIVGDAVDYPREIRKQCTPKLPVDRQCVA